jgi:hypothetical protein
MKARAKDVLTQLLVLLLSVSIAFGQNIPPEQGEPAFTQQELDQMLAPIALYPDSLLSQILMASTYSLEVVQAARWSRANPNLKGDEAVRAVEQNNWDPSVKSLVAFPQILMMMDEKLDWTGRLGDAFLGQQTQVMDTVQDLRQKAQAAGNLQSNEIERVEPQGQTIVIEQANPQVVYVPYYNPSVVYGPWWWSDYPPVYWGPWPGYYERPGFGAGFFWGAGITLGAGFFFGAFDWPHRHVNVGNVNSYYYRPSPRIANGPRGGWQHDPGHRRGVPYREASLRQQFGRTSPSPEARRDFRGRDPSSSQALRRPATRPDARTGPGGRPEQRSSPPSRVDGPGARPNAGRTPARPNVPAISRPEPRSAPIRPNVPEVSRPEPRSAPSRPNLPGVIGRPAVEPRPAIFEGVGQGATVRDSSARGHSSNPGMVPRSNSAPASRPSGSVSAPRPGGNASPGRPSGTGRGNDRDSRQQR